MCNVLVQKQGDQNLPLSNIVYLLSLSVLALQGVATNKWTSVYIGEQYSNQRDYVECFCLCRMRKNTLCRA